MSVIHGPTTSAPPPSTTVSPSETASLPRSRLAGAPLVNDEIVPPFRVSAEAPMLIPSASRSAAATV